jgi:hypothetical protein
LRIEYPAAIYHLMNRGDHREDIAAGHDKALPVDGRASGSVLREK